MAPTTGSTKVPAPLTDSGGGRCASAIAFPESEGPCGGDTRGYSSVHVVAGVPPNSGTPGTGLLGMLPPLQPRARTSQVQTLRRSEVSTRRKQPGDLCLATLLEHAISSRLHKCAEYVSVDSPATTSELDTQDALLAARIRASLARLSTSHPTLLSASYVNPQSLPCSMPTLVATLLLRRHERRAGSEIAHCAHGIPAWSPRASPLRQSLCSDPS
ncbi:hypothetical protein B0H13DRAFT_2342353 [Mycena leptocephala]|nr:hypothetical protein B0H13DRAFT_2342353 [Mycena leptocephala]